MSLMTQLLTEEDVEEAVKRYVEQQPYFFIEGRRIVDVMLKWTKREGVTATVETDVRSELETPILEEISFDKKTYDLLKAQEKGGEVSHRLSISFSDDEEEDSIDEGEEE